MKNISYQDFIKIISDHNFWLLTNGNKSEQANFSNFDLSEVMIKYYDNRNIGISGSLELSKINFSQAKITNSILYGKFDGCDFSYANLKNTVLKGSFKNCNFTGAKMNFAKTESFYFGKNEPTDFSGSIFSGTNLEMCNFAYSKFDNCLFEFVQGNGLKISNSKLCNTQIKESCLFNYSDFGDCWFRDSYIEESVFNGVNMNNIYFENTRIKSCDLKESMIAYATFSHGDLQNNTFIGAYIENTDFPHTTITNCYFDEEYNIEQSKSNKENKNIER